MGRFDTLNDTTKDVVVCLIPALAIDFGLDADKAVEIIPADIRMRVWDCERRDHVKDETEDDPRNWGVQFLKDLKAIARIKKGDLATFQADLYAKVAKHEEKHPWARLQDIKELKDEYLHPNRAMPVVQEESEGSSTDSYFEELREPELPKGVKRRGEVYEAVTQTSSKRKKRKYLRTGNFDFASANDLQQKLDFAAPRMAASCAKTRARSVPPTLAPTFVSPARPLISQSVVRHVLLSLMQTMISTLAAFSLAIPPLPSPAPLHLSTVLVWPQLQ